MSDDYSITDVSNDQMIVDFAAKKVKPEND